MIRTRVIKECIENEETITVTTMTKTIITTVIMTIFIIIMIMRIKMGNRMEI